MIMLIRVIARVESLAISILGGFERVENQEARIKTEAHLDRNFQLE